MMGLIQDRRGSGKSQNTPKDLEAFVTLYEAVQNPMAIYLPTE